MNSNLNVTLVQANLNWENIAANLQHFTALLAPVQQTDLIVLPEMFSTGFSMNAAALAEPMDGSAVQWMKELATQKQCAITGSLIITEGGNYFNRLVWVMPDGKLHTYDKRHLFSLTDEPRIFTAGTNRLIVNLNGWNICPLVCYDLRFPVWARNTINPDTGLPYYDVLLYVANWPERRSHAWKSLLVARAIENQCYTIGVNRIGDDGTGMPHSGDSMVIDALGATLYHKAKTEDVHTITLDYTNLQHTRQQLPFLKDADTFTLNTKLKT